MKFRLAPFNPRPLVSVSVPTPGAKKLPARLVTVPPMVPKPPKVAPLATVTLLVTAAELPFINSVPPTGIAGRFIVNAKSMNGYLKKKWGTDSTCSKTAAYYFKSKTNRGDFQGLLGEILAVTIKCKCGGGGFVAVVSSVVNETGVSGHVGVVTPTYHDHYTPYGDSIDVWILPSTL